MVTSQGCIPAAHTAAAISRSPLLPSSLQGPPTHFISLRMKMTICDTQNPNDEWVITADRLITSAARSRIQPPPVLISCTGAGSASLQAASSYH